MKEAALYALATVSECLENLDEELCLFFLFLFFLLLLLLLLFVFLFSFSFGLTVLDNDWRIREAALYALASVSECLDNSDEELQFISKIINISATVPFSPFPLGRSLIRFFGLYLNLYSY